MVRSKNGDRVKVHYTGKLQDGQVFDSSEGSDPLEFTIGEGGIIPGFEQGVLDMEIGESKKITIPPEAAYGQKRDELVVVMKKDEFPTDIKPELGQQLQLKQPDGNPINVVVSSMEEDEVTLDANHPLAGETLVFKVEMVEIA